jgi:hypothetical protein
LKGAKRNKSVSKNSSILLLIGFAFFINPVPLGFDILPDVFGCILIFFGLTQLAYFDGKIEQARKAVLYLLIAESVNLLMMRSIFSAEISSNRMLAVTIFSIVQGILYIMLFKTLFGGINYYCIRSNCNKTLTRCDGTAFMSYLAFFTRIAATLIPELLATVEIYLSAESDVELELSDTYAIEALMSAKPLLVLLFSFIALITGIAWFVSFYKTIKLFHQEAGSDLDQRYATEYASKPENIQNGKLNRGINLLFIAIFFSLDIAFDNIRIIPASAMFLFVFLASFFLKGLCDFKQTKRLAPIAAILLLGAEIFRLEFVPNGAIVIYETKLWIIAVNALICVVTVPLCLLCIRCFLIELNEMQQRLGGSKLSINKCWIPYCVSLILWSIGYVVPYFYPSVATLRLAASCVFIWQTVRFLSTIKEDEQERFLMYRK